MRRSPHRIGHQALRARVRALHLQREQEELGGGGALEAHDLTNYGSQSLVTSLRQAISRRGSPGARGQMMARAYPLALWGLTRDPAEEVVVAFAVEYVLDQLALMSSTGDDAPSLFRNGMPCVPNPAPGASTLAQCRTAYTAEDLDRLRHLPGVVAQGLAGPDETCLAGTWFPEIETAVHTSDMIRPPVEALAVVALDAGAVEVSTFTAIVEIGASTVVGKQVLAIGLGHQAGAQALSVMLPDADIYTDAGPYHGNPVEPRAWDLLVVNIPLASTIEVAACLGSGGSEEQPSVREFGEVRSRSRRALDARVDHIPGLLARVGRHAHAGCRLTVLADPQLARVVQDALTAKGYTRSELAAGDRRLPAVYSGGEVHPEGLRRPGRRGLPAPTGRVLSAWVCP